MADPPEVPDAPVQPNPDEQPATRGELRTVRRWLLVTAVWALAATAVALIALITLDETAEKEARNVAEEVTRLQRDVGPRLEAVEEEVADVPRQEDVTNLEQRLSRVEGDSSKSANDAKDAKTRVDDLETRIEELENDVDTGADSSPGNSGDSGDGNSPGNSGN